MSDASGGEKVIDLNELGKKSDNVEPPKEKNVAANVKFVERKRVDQLTDSERATIISNFMNNIEQPHFTCKAFKNGTFRIIKAIL